MTIIHGDCLEVMAGMEPESVDAIVTDPPYGLEFMGKEWDKLDGGLPQENVWKGRRGKGGSSIGHDDSKPQSRHHVGYGGGQQGFKRCTTCGKRAFSGSPCQCPEPTWVVEYNQTAPSASLRMGRWHQRWAEAAYRVAKPSSYLLAFGGTRTVHRMTVALEDAGWIIRDMLVWGYASGFPKSKASLKPAWEPIVMARKPGPLRMLAIDATRLPTADQPTSPDGSDSSDAYSTWRIDPWHTDETRLHNPSTALMAWSAARPEADSALLASVLASAFVGRGLRDYRADYPSCRRCGDGLVQIAEASDRDDSPLRPDVPGAPPLREWSASHIRESRCDDHRAIWDELARVVEEADASAYGNDITSAPRRDRFGGGAKGSSGFATGYQRGDGFAESTLGRWPANIVLTDPIFDGGIEGVVGGGETQGGQFPRDPSNHLPPGQAIYGGGNGLGIRPEQEPRSMDSGTYSRFFLIPKAARSDREPVLGGLPLTLRTMGDGIGEYTRHAPGAIQRQNVHPTVKPTDLMRHLVRLVTPAGGTVLDPFLGSGTTGLAAEMEGFAWIGIEREAEYVAIAEARLNGTQRGLGI